VAFATVALREFLAGGATELSEQFLYWACKELDGSEGPGTNIHTAMSALNEYGVCPASLWPYNPRQAEGDEAQGPPSAKALKAAEDYRLAQTRTVEPTLAEHYKQMLAGDPQTPGMPVVFATLVFNSWFMSAETHRTGKITIPLPGEQPLGGGHAWCIVGYVDDASVPGGGYFIVRNSWSREWAPASPEAPGHALMPYAYVEQCAVEAFTGPGGGVARQIPRQDGDWTNLGLRRILSQEQRDREGRLLPAGTAVLGNPSEPGVFSEDTPANRKQLLDLDYAWSDKVRQGLWFPRLAELPAGLTAQLDALGSLKRKYLSAIEENLAAARRSPFPFVRVPGWFHVLPYEWEPKVKRIELQADLTDGLFEIARTRCGARTGLEWPTEWIERFKELNTVRLFSLSGFASEVHVVVAFLARLTFQRQRAPELLPLDQDWVASAERAYQRWTAARAGGSPNFTFFAIGTGDGLVATLENVTAGGQWVVLASPAPGGKWASPKLEKFPRRLALRDFLERLLPETREERVCRIKECVDGLFIEGGNVTLSRVKSETGYRKSAVRDAFFQLQRSAPDLYRLWKKDEELAVRKAAKDDPVRITAASFGRRFLRRHSLRVVAVALGSAIGLLSGWLVKRLGLSGYLGFVLGLLIAYVGSLVQSHINRRADKDDE